MRKRLLLIQLLLIGLGLVLTASFWGLSHAMALSYGGVMVMLNTALLQWRHAQANEKAGRDLARNMRIIYRTAAERFMLVLVLFVIGIGVLKLEPRALIAGFALLQLAQFLDWFIESRMRRHHGKRRDPYLW
ncbi:MAG: ATP synthase subunit I [Gammaproteobacteria bacterium]|nr:ATP synthase subunit I [Gammaproteobacteria bacterium]